MSAVRHIGWWGALGVLALTVAGCAAKAEPGGPALAVNVQQPACPDTRPTTTLPDVPGPAMVPGTPTGAWGCRYQGLNDPHPGALVRSAQATGARLTRLVSTLNTAGPWRSGMYCPIDLGLRDLIVFDYASGNSVEVLVSVTGCASAT
ncbi:MAG TPA: hypothetical protein VGD84_17505, partial [Pseudonocardiaceae bacterium]